MDDPQQIHGPGRRLERLHIWQVQAIRDVLVIGGFVLLVWVGYWLRAVTIPLLIAIALAYLVEPIVARLSGHPRLSRRLVVAGMLAILATLFTVAVLTIIPLLIFQTIDLVQELPGNLRRLSTAVEPYVPEEYREGYRELREAILTPARADERASDVEPSEENGDGGDDQPIDDELDGPTDDEREDAEPPLPTGDDDLVNGVETAPGEPGAQTVAETDDDLAAARSWLQANIGSIFRTTIQTTGEAAEWLLSALGVGVYMAFLLFLIPFYFFAFSVSWPNVRRFFRGLIPVAHAERTHRILDKMDRAISGFVRGRIMISVIMGILLAAGWGIVGVPYWMLVGLITGVFCAVPYLGGVGLPVAIILLWIGEAGRPPDERMAWWAILLWPSVVFLIVQLIEGYVLTPLIAGKQTNLGPVSILVAVLAGGAVMGIYGMLLAIPAAACLKILITEMWLPRVQAWAEGRASDILPISEAD